MRPDVGFAVQEALARNDRRALAELVPCTCNDDDYDYDVGTDACPAKVWNGCRALEYEEWDSRGSDWEFDLDARLDGLRSDVDLDPDDDIPTSEALSAHATEISKLCPAGWEARWKPSRELLAITNEASDRVFVIRMAEGDIGVTVESHDLATAYEAPESTKVPARTYFTPAWIIRMLRPLFLKYHP